MSGIGLMLEGGGMKCAYSAGVTDAFLANGITFDYVVGVSAGSANGASFLAGQYGRTRRFYTDHIKDPKYFGIRNFLSCGDMFNMKYIYATLSNEGGADYLDYDAFIANPSGFESVATNALTGKPVYFPKENMQRNNYLEIMASSSIPAICKPIFIDGVPYYDGGLSDALPYRRLFQKGCKKVVCVLSKSRSYVRKPDKFRPFYALMCRKYPNAVRAIDNRYLRYTKQQQKMYELEKAGKIFIFSLETDIEIGTYTMDPELNEKIYQQGLQDFEEKKEALAEFMKA